MLEQLIKDITSRTAWKLEGYFDNRSESFICFQAPKEELEYLRDKQQIKYLRDKSTNEVFITLDDRPTKLDPINWNKLCENWSR